MSEIERTSRPLRTLGIVLIVLGAALLVVGIVYFTVPADKLPGFLGHVAGSTRYHSKRAIAAAGAAAICWIVAAILLMRSRSNGTSAT